MLGSEWKDPSGGNRAKGSEQKHPSGEIRAEGTEQRNPSTKDPKGGI